MNEDVVIFGGTFDPFTVGHRAAAEQLRDAIDAEVFIVPANIPPLRPPTQASFEDRVRMCRAGIRGLENVDVLEIERDRTEPSYTFNTMREMREKLPDARLWIAIGADAARHVKQWYRSAELLAGFNFVLFNRMSEGVSAPADLSDFPAGRTRALDIVSPDVSATQVRTRIQAGTAYSSLVAPEVAEIIQQRHLYEKPDKMLRSGPAYV